MQGEAAPKSENKRNKLDNHVCLEMDIYEPKYLFRLAIMLATVFGPPSPYSTH